MFGRMYVAGQPLMICGVCGALVHPMQEGDHREFHEPVVHVVEATDRDDTDSVWVLWDMEAGPEFIGVYGSRAGADAAQVSRNLAEFHIHREEIR